MEGRIQARPGLIPVPSFAGLPRRPVVQEIRSVACWAKKKGTRIIVTLECTEARAEGKPPSRYTTQKNKRNTPDRLELMKYNRFLRRHTLHKEIK